MDFQPSNTIVNGYFYSFTYNPPTLSKGYDKFPLVFVLGPSTKSLNNFVAINLHHLPSQVRKTFIVQFQKAFKFMNNQRTVITEETCANLTSGITLAKREYNKKYVSDCMRIDAKSIPLFLGGNGHITQERPDNIMMQWLEKRGLYHLQESKK